MALQNSTGNVRWLRDPYHKIPSRIAYQYGNLAGPAKWYPFSGRVSFGAGPLLETTWLATEAGYNIRSPAISLETVRQHIKNIYRKLQVDSKTEVIIKSLKGEL